MNKNRKTKNEKNDDTATVRQILLITAIINLLNAVVIKNDCLAPFLNSYDFEDVYETEDNSLVFEAGGANDISIEFFDFEHPLKREMSIMYYENNKPVILYY